VLILSTALFAVVMVMWHRTWVLRHRAVNVAPHPPAVPEIEAEPEPEPEPENGQRIAVIINPIKAGADTFTNQLVVECAAEKLPKPKFYETTVKSPGTKQAAEAIANGADVVIVAGGDGTVRAAAAGMVHSGVPMAIIPLGTGNLLARNLDLPIASLERLIQVAIHGTARPIDVGWVQVTKSTALVVEESDDIAEKSDLPSPITQADEMADPTVMIPELSSPETSGIVAAAVTKEVIEAKPSPPELFTVIAGVGFDAAMVADTEDRLKRKVGWMAYFMAAAHNIANRRVKALVTIDDYPRSLVEARTIMVGNCGRLPGAITLLPNAQLDDGKIDIAAVDTRAGLTGWAALFGTVVLQGAGISSTNYPKIGEIHFAQGERVHIDLARPAHAQVDGDALGPIEVMEAWVDRDALLVRT